VAQKPYFDLHEKEILPEFRRTLPRCRIAPSVPAERQSMGRKGGGLGTTLVLALVIVVLAVALGVGLARYGSTLPLLGQLLGKKPPRTTTGPVVVEGIQDLDRLATVRWTESVPVTKESGGDIWERVFNGEKVLVIATGNVEAGVDLGDIHKDDVSVNGDAVTIDLPEPEILSASLDEKTTRVYDRDLSPEHPSGGRPRRGSSTAGGAEDQSLRPREWDPGYRQRERRR